MSPNDERRLERLRTMSRIRAFEEQVGRHFRGGNIHGFVHTSIGQEAVAAGTCGILERDDRITTTHRGHGHCLAKGAQPEAMMAELFGREDGSCRGRGGSMHLAEPARGILGANGIVGAGIPIAVGAALASRLTHDDAVAVAFFGEGATHSGAFHEGLTLAVAWQAPVLFVCEDNRYAEFTASDKAWRAQPLTDRAAAYGIPAVTVDGNDVDAVEAAAAEAAARARAGDGPRFLHMRTFRAGGHYEGDAQPYRDPDELATFGELDPIVRLRKLVPADVADRIAEEAVEEMRRAVDAALAAPYPEPSTVLEFVDG